MKHITELLTSFAWIVIPSVLLLIACAVDKLPAWHRVADRGAIRVKQ